ncbi:5-Enolpyruvylshikimate-3-phosphate synthase [Desulfurella amilsii]|uniref:3-phosphoshikimate 1-carboxyvinyltransferase n=1 Tax=Desulfurella amilsii TaxID=1562698 RepID=A0A1X4XX08_9BACT|nr:3-phosphoshikimate 1-carboxyvinyltransferase [Desulfurella amilsii]OSS42065.1 5-Enolpyruvylshikimate-3-phosphate synthase [Desulfurella amilsii]
MDKVKTLRCASDKSISHRSAIFSSIAYGTNTIKNYLFAQDTLNTIKAFKKLGVEISIDNGIVSIKGNGKYLKEASDIIDLGNSGTGMRLISAVCAGQNFLSILTGDNSLKNRPMKRIIEPLAQMGATILSRKNFLAPLAIFGKNNLSGIQYNSNIASAQVKSACLIAGLYTDEKVEFSEPHLSRNHTEIMLKQFGVDLTIENRKITLGKNRELHGNFEIDVPADISSCAFVMVMCALKPNCEAIFFDCLVNPTRTGILKVFSDMGVNYEILNKKAMCGEEVADILVRYSPNLNPFYIDGEILPTLIDEIPALSILALFAGKPSILKDAKELRVKESDRIKSIVENLKKLGVSVEEYEDGFKIQPSKKLQKAYIETHFDHRIAMSFSILKALGYSLDLSETKSPNTSYPNFFEHLKYLGS